MKYSKNTLSLIVYSIQIIKNSILKFKIMKTPGLEPGLSP